MRKIGICVFCLLLLQLVLIAHDHLITTKYQYCFYFPITKDISLVILLGSDSIQPEKTQHKNFPLI